MKERTAQLFLENKLSGFNPSLIIFYNLPQLSYDCMFCEGQHFFTSLGGYEVLRPPDALGLELLKEVCKGKSSLIAWHF